MPEGTIIEVNGKRFATTERKCPTCEDFLVSDAHSVGRLHAVCLTCKYCPDCDDGAV